MSSRMKSEATDMGQFRPWESYDSDFDKDFIAKARFTCKACKKKCSLKEGSLRADEEKMFAYGKCSECGKDLKYDVTNVWREE